MRTEEYWSGMAKVSKKHLIGVEDQEAIIRECSVQLMPSKGHPDVSMGDEKASIR